MQNSFGQAGQAGRADTSWRTYQAEAGKENDGHAHKVDGDIGATLVVCAILIRITKTRAVS